MKPRILSTLLVTLTISVTSEAQLKSPVNDQVQLENIKKFTDTKNAGVVLTVLGGAVAAMGAAVFFTPVSLTFTSADEAKFDQKHKLGVTCFIVGGAGLATGIPLWITGAKKLRDAKTNQPILEIAVGTNVNSALTVRLKL